MRLKRAIAVKKDGRKAMREARLVLELLADFLVKTHESAEDRDDGELLHLSASLRKLAQDGAQRLH